MIKSTFYNLPEEKRQRITDAIFNEFAGSSGERFSINNIIKNANISRGSFYQYFDDKVDLVEVMTRSFINFSLKKATEVISRTHGDIFVTYDLLFEILCECSKVIKGISSHLGEMAGNFSYYAGWSSIQLRYIPRLYLSIFPDF